MVCPQEYREEEGLAKGGFLARPEKSSYIRANVLRRSALMSVLNGRVGDYRRPFTTVFDTWKKAGSPDRLSKGWSPVSTLVPNCPGSFDRGGLVVYNLIPCYRMTQLIQRLGSVAMLVMIGFGLLVATPNDTEAKKRSAGTAKKLSHNGSTASKKNAKKNRSAKASRATLARLERAKSDKLALAEKIKQLSTSQLVSDDVALEFDLEAELAQAAKEEAEEDDVEVSIEQFFRARPGAIGAEMDPELVRARQIDFTLYDEADPTTAAKRSDVMQNIIDWMGTRYVFGGVGRSGIDCSAFTREIYAKTFGIELPRTANLQHRLGESVRKQELQFGDLVFFQTARYAPVTHVGIYIGEGLFANAASSKGVSLASLDSKYWSKRYLGGKRLFTNSALASTGYRASNMASQDKAIDPSELPH
jgi:cell wall-associated NlpC family hydrolase